jgi:hypothetical protein
MSVSNTAVRAGVLGVWGFALGLFACSNNDYLKSKLDTRAKFDLNCQKLAYTPLDKHGPEITAYGVEGCGHRATYVLQGSTWIMNVSDGQASNVPEEGRRGGPPPPHVPPPALPK